jgi:hypothetical protein
MAAALPVLAVASGAFSIFSGVNQIRASNSSAKLTQYGIDVQQQFNERAYKADVQAAEAAGLMGVMEATMTKLQVAGQMRDAAYAVQDILDQATFAKIDNRKFLADQGTDFIKAGVDLAGSPLMVLTETKLNGVKDVKSLTARAVAIAEKGQIEGSVGLASADARRISAGLDRTNLLIAAGLRRDQGNFNAVYSAASNRLNQSSGTMAGLTTMLQGFTSIASLGK